MDAAKRGATALDAGDCATAIKEYTSALSQMPKAVDYYLKRSTAFQRSQPPQYDLALKDAEKGLHFAFERAKRELIAQAQLRRTTILFNLGEYANAGFVLGFVKKFDEKNKMIAIWEAKIAGKLKGLGEDDPARAVTTVERPKVDLTEGGAKAEAKTASTTTAATTTSTAGAAVAEAPKVLQTPPSQIKHDWYQNKDNVYFSLLAKGVPQDKAHIDIEEHAISISFPTATGTDYAYTIDPLFAAIDTSASTTRISAAKVELTLRKREPGVKWKTLEGSEAAAPNASSTTAATTTTATTNDPIRTAVLSSTTSGAPAYPTSSKTGPKNWDKIVSDATAKPTTHKKDGGGASSDGDGEGEGLDDMDDLDYGGDEANFFFKKLYKDADDDTKRAMMKSYVESNGTVLSTNWSEVGKGKVETSPPDGMEARKWGG